MWKDSGIGRNPFRWVESGKSSYNVVLRPSSFLLCALISTEPFSQPWTDDFCDFDSRLTGCLFPISKPPNTRTLLIRTSSECQWEKENGIRCKEVQLVRISHSPELWTWGTWQYAHPTLHSRLECPSYPLLSTEQSIIRKHFRKRWLWAV